MFFQKIIEINIDIGKKSRKYDFEKHNIGTDIISNINLFLLKDSKSNNEISIIPTKLK